MYRLEHFVVGQDGRIGFEFTFKRVRTVGAVETSCGINFTSVVDSE